MSTGLLEPCGHPTLYAPGLSCEEPAGHRGPHVVHAANGARITWPNVRLAPDGSSYQDDGH